MRLGLFGVNFGAMVDPVRQRRVVQAAEASGFESVWTGEHVAMPIENNPVPIPPETPFLDALVALARIAGCTERVRLGTGIIVLPHHNPVLLAKSLASLDVLSGGRLLVGVASGYVEAEFRALGADFRRRGAKTDDAIRAMRTLWTEAEPRHRGPFAAFDGIRFEPKPVQRPHPPLIVGGRSPAALRRAAREGDGWYGYALTVDETAGIVRELARLRGELGRGDAPFEISLTTFEPFDEALVERAAAAGIDRLIWFPRVRPDALEDAVRETGARFARTT